MTKNSAFNRGQRGSLWRKAGWSLAALVLLLPWVAMQFTGEVNWDAFDFAFAGALVIGTGVAYELAVKRTDNAAYRAGAGVALATTFLLLWLSGSVGIIGRDGDPANLMYLGVPAIGIIAALIARFRAQGMAFALLATAVTQALIAAIALLGKLGQPWSGPRELLSLNGFFVVLYLGAALLFRNAAREGADTGRQRQAPKG